MKVEKVKEGEEEENMEKVKSLGKRKERRREYDTGDRVTRRMKGVWEAVLTADVSLYLSYKALLHYVIPKFSPSFL